MMTDVDQIINLQKAQQRKYAAKAIEAASGSANTTTTTGTSGTSAVEVERREKFLFSLQKLMNEANAIPEAFVKISNRLRGNSFSSKQQQQNADDPDRNKNQGQQQQNDFLGSTLNGVINLASVAMNNNNNSSSPSSSSIRRTNHQSKNQLQDLIREFTAATAAKRREQLKKDSKEREREYSKIQKEFDDCGVGLTLARKYKQQEERDRRRDEKLKEIIKVNNNNNNNNNNAAGGIGVNTSTSASENTNSNNKNAGIIFFENSAKHGTFSSFRISAGDYKFLFNRYIVRDVKAHLYFPLVCFFSLLLYIAIIVPILEHRESSAWLAEGLEAALRDNQYLTFCDDPGCRSGFTHRKTFNDLGYISDIEQYFKLNFIPQIFPDSLPFAVPSRFENDTSSFPVAFDDSIRRVSPISIRQVRAASKVCNLPTVTTPQNQHQHHQRRTSSSSSSSTSSDEELKLLYSLGAGDASRVNTIRQANCYDNNEWAKDEMYRPEDSLLDESAYVWNEEACPEREDITGSYDVYPCSGYLATIENRSQMEYVHKWLSPSAKLVVISASFRALLADVFDHDYYNSEQNSSSTSNTSSGSTSRRPRHSSSSSSTSTSSTSDFISSVSYTPGLGDTAQNLTMRISLFVEMLPGGGNANAWVYTAANSQVLFRYSTAGFLFVAAELLVFLFRCGSFVYVRYIVRDYIRASHKFPEIPRSAIFGFGWSFFVTLTNAEDHLKQSRILAGLIIASTAMFLKYTVFVVAKLMTYRAANLLRIMELSLTAFWIVVPFMFLAAGGFVLSGFFVFGRTCPDFATVRSAVRFVSRGLLFEWDFDALQQQRPVTGLLFTVLFFSVVLVVLTNLLLTLMTGAAEDAKPDAESVEFIQKTADFMKQKLYTQEAVAVYLAWHLADDNLLKRIWITMSNYYELYFASGNHRTRLKRRLRMMSKNKLPSLMKTATSSNDEELSLMNLSTNENSNSSRKRSRGGRRRSSASSLPPILASSSLPSLSSSHQQDQQHVSASSSSSTTHHQQRTRQFFITQSGRFCRPAEAIMFLVPCHRFNELAKILRMSTIPENFLFSVALYITELELKFRKQFRDQHTMDETLESHLASFNAY